MNSHMNSDMNSYMNSYMRLIRLFVFVLLLPLSNMVVGQHHEHQSHAMPEANEEQAMQTMQMESMGSMPVAPGALRDPHEYSNGFVRDSGPYTLAREDQLRLADETTFTGLWVDRFEYVESHDTDATEFEGQAWIGDSYNRYLLRSEIEVINDHLHVAEIDLLHTRAISPFWDVRFGVRHEVRDEGSRNWASIGLGGLAPYWFEIDASLFLGESGNSLLDIEA